MRLLHSNTLKFHEFHENIPLYAILSHTWGDDEVTFKDMKKHSLKAQSKLGYEKIIYCTKQARQDGYDYFWVDICCM